MSQPIVLPSKTPSVKKFVVRRIDETIRFAFECDYVGVDGGVVELFWYDPEARGQENVRPDDVPLRCFCLAPGESVSQIP